MTGDTEELVLLGRLNGVWGVAGWLRVFSDTDPPEAIFQYQPWYLGESKDVMEVLEWRRVGPRLVARFSGIESREQAERLGPLPIRVPASALPPPPQGSFYWRDLIGLAVFSRAGEPLGKVVRMMDSPAHDLLVVQDQSAPELLIPFVIGQTIDQVDLDGGRITVDWSTEWL